MRKNIDFGTLGPRSRPFLYGSFNGMVSNESYSLYLIRFNSGAVVIFSHMWDILIASFILGDKEWRLMPLVPGEEGP
jgi:hypothetical protein